MAIEPSNDLLQLVSNFAIELKNIMLNGEEGDVLSVDALNKPVWTASLQSTISSLQNDLDLIETLLASGSEGDILSVDSLGDPEWVSPPTHLPIRTETLTSDTTPNPDCDNYDMYVLTGLTGNATIAAPTGTPIQGQKFLFRIKDSGSSRTLTWNSIYRSLGVDLPTATTAGKTMYVGFIYNSTESKWDCVALTEQA